MNSRHPSSPGGPTRPGLTDLPAVHTPPGPGSGCTRRSFLEAAAWGSLGSLLPWTPIQAAGLSSQDWDPQRPLRKLGRALRVQPVFMYALPTRREQASWRSWGGVQTPTAVEEEVARIERELKTVQAQAEFGLELRSVARITTAEQAAGMARRDHDVTLAYACTGSGALLRACLGGKHHALIFVRHRNGPVYYWYEALSSRYLKADHAPTGGGAASDAPEPHVDDVVVDDPKELLWRLRALNGMTNLLGTRIVALGGPWGKYAPDAPEKARARFQIEIVDEPYETFAPKLAKARRDPVLLRAAEQATRRYLKLPGTKLRAERQAVVNAFVLYRVFKDLMEEHGATAFTIKSCMGTIIPMSETTACLPLEVLNDEGLIAFCESDFVIIPAGLLLRHVAGKPVFLHNSTFPHQRVVTCAHCTCPRRLDGRRYAPAEILTHYESDYGAAPKVSMPIGQKVTFLDPEYSTTRWLGFRGVVKGNPFLEICRSQQDVEIEGDWQKLRGEARDSHWMMVYGDYLAELGYATRKLGLDWATVA